MEIPLKKFKVRPRLYTHVHHKRVVYPQILLTGKWLKRFGFTIGSHVIMQCVDEKIIITLEQPAIHSHH